MPKRSDRKSGGCAKVPRKNRPPLEGINGNWLDLIGQIPADEFERREYSASYTHHELLNTLLKWRFVERADLGRYRVREQSFVEECRRLGKDTRWFDTVLLRAGGLAFLAAHSCAGRAPLAAVTGLDPGQWARVAEAFASFGLVRPLTSRSTSLTERATSLEPFALAYRALLASRSPVGFPFCIYQSGTEAAFSRQLQLPRGWVDEPFSLVTTNGSSPDAGAQVQVRARRRLSEPDLLFLLTRCKTATPWGQLCVPPPALVARLASRFDLNQLSSPHVGALADLYGMPTIIAEMRELHLGYEEFPGVRPRKGWEPGEPVAWRDPKELAHGTRARGKHIGVYGSLEETVDHWRLVARRSSREMTARAARLDRPNPRTRGM